MFRRLLLLPGLLPLASLSAQAQDKVELSGGYSCMRLHNSPSADLNGWEIAGQYKFTASCPMRKSAMAFHLA
jgi:hypothetical protein